ncbi:MAG: GNAT family N-acetyltransferase [Planctomycetes bacterium]|nr:GNAT family N-acetyltransferase [Planctomycetota bacterium]
MEVASTERLVLRELTADDAAEMFALNADPEVLRYLSDVPYASVDAARAFLEAYPEYRRRGFGRWAVIERESNSFVGWCGLKDIAGVVDLGYRLHRRFWSRGFATEAARASLRLGFERFALERVVGRALPANLASRRVLEKCGMRLWKRAPHDGFDDVVHYVVERGAP